MSKLTQKRLRTLVSYDPDTGVFVRLSSDVRKDLIGRRTGWIAVNGYPYLVIDRKQYLAHRVAWFYMTGRWPRKQIDHVDGNPENCKFSNLRQSSQLQNMWNSRRPITNTSGFKGVSFFKRDGTWRAVIKVHGRFVHIGYFNSPEVAHDAYVAYAKRYFGEFARAP